jgi:alginate O-acetyltransferase complex protein AlgI
VLFNSFLFLVGFLPIVLTIMFFLADRKPSLAPAWLAIASLVFYAGWSFVYVPLLVGSMTFNYAIGRRISRFVADHNAAAARAWIWFGVVCNLLVLGYYKYAGFIGEIVHGSIGLELNLANIVLPIGISFFTFTQIAYLVDARRGLTREYEPVRYGLFVSYFPHLVAGPILHHREMIEQFAKRDAFRFNGQDLAAGLTLFAIGLAKKVLLADSIAPVANAVFTMSSTPGLTTAEAWGKIPKGFPPLLEIQGMRLA